MRTKLTIPVHNEQELTPKAKDTIYGILEDRFPEHTITFSRADVGFEVGPQVLVLGRVTNGYPYPYDVRLVHTYSVAQIMTKPNAASVLAAAVRQFIDEPEPIPFDSPVYTASTYAIRMQLDLDAPVAVDIETWGNFGKGGEHTVEDVGLLSVAFYQPGVRPIVLVSSVETATDTGTNPIDLSYQLDELRELLQRIKYPIYHNGKFDTRVLNRILGTKLNVWFDTMLAHHVLNQAAGEHGLKALAQRYLGAEDWEGDIKKYLHKGAYYERIPRHRIVMYNGYDVYWTYKLYEFLSPQIASDEEAEKAFYFELQAADFLLDVETYGIPFDNEYAETLEYEMSTEAYRAKARMRDIIGYSEFNPNSPKQVKEALATLGKFVSSTDEDTIKRILESAVGDLKSFCTKLLEFRKAMKTASTYATGWSLKSRNGRVHPTFLVHGTSTGRLSSTGPNAQNVPRSKQIRRMVKTNG